jgi:glycosyltransferase involved in cell wall biosynthesis
MTLPTNVLFVHWGHEGIRGSERVLLDLLGELDRARFSASLWCNSETLAAAAEDLDVETRVSAMPLLFGWDAPRFDLRSFRALVAEGRALIRDKDVGVVHVTSGAPTQWMSLAARSERVPLIAHLHAIYRFRERCTLLLHQAPILAGCSDAVLEPFRRDGLAPDRLRVINNGVNPQRLAAGNARGLRGSLGISRDAIVLLAAGALVPLKGFDTLLRAVHAVRGRGINAQLLIAGEGPGRDALSRLSQALGITSAVHLLGQQPHLGAILRDAADIALIGSIVESFGLVAAEAGAMGRPTVASRVGGIPEVIADGVTGLLVPAGDHGGFADAIASLAADPVRRTTMGNAARRRVLERFTTARAARDVESLYSALVATSTEAYGWKQLGFRAAPLAKLGLAVAGRRLGLRISDA